MLPKSRKIDLWSKVFTDNHCEMSHDLHLERSSWDIKKKSILDLFFRCPAEAKVTTADTEVPQGQTLKKCRFVDTPPHPGTARHLEKLSLRKGLRLSRKKGYAHFA